MHPISPTVQKPTQGSNELPPAPDSSTTERPVAAEVRRIYGLALRRWMREHRAFPSEGEVRVMDAEAEGYRAMNDETLAVHADFAEASFRSLPAD